MWALLIIGMLRACMMAIINPSKVAAKQISNYSDSIIYCA